MYRFKHVLWVLIFTHQFSFTNGQPSKICSYQFKLEPVVKYGKILKHTVNFKPAIEQHSFSAEFNFAWQSNGDKEWQRMLHYPAWGITTGYTFFGNKNILGDEYYIVPNIQFRLAGKKNVQLWLKAGVGLAWLTRHYDALQNPTNDVIASAINNSSTLAMRLKIKVTQKINLVAGGSFTHSSTGDVRMPNLGINVPTFDFGFLYSFSEEKNELFNHDSLSPVKRKSMVLTVRNGIGMYEIFIPDGPIYPILINETGIGKYFGRWNKFSAGFETFYSAANFHFEKEQQIGNAYLKQSIAVASFIQDEMEWGPVSFTMMMACQLKPTTLSGTLLYQKLGVNHTVFSFGKLKEHKLSLGIFLTTHWANADYVSSLLSFQL